MKYNLATPAGTLELLVEEGCLCGSRFVDEAPDDVCPPPFVPFKQEFDEYFSGMRKRFTFPWRMAGSPFRRRVWQELLRIPFGTTISYGALARRIGNPSATRALAGACHANPLAVVVPCHRVVAAGGRPGGYAAGLEVKLWLLHLETRDSLAF